MADFTLVVGVDTNLSFTEMQNGINGIINKLNANPPKIKIQFDDASLKSMRDQIKKLYTDMGAGTAKSPVNTKAITDVAKQATNAANAVQGMNKAINSTSDAAKNASSAEKQLKKIADAATQARALLNNNMEASGSASYQKLNAELTKLEEVLEICGGDSAKLSAALQETGTNGENAVSRLNTAMSTLKNELQAAGSAGTVSLRQLIETATQMQNLLNRNPQMAGTAQYSALTAQLNQFRSIITACNGDATKLEAAMKNAGVNGATAINNAKTAMASFKQTVSETVAAEQQAEAASKNATAAEKERQSAVKASESAEKQRVATVKSYQTALIQGEKALRNWSAAENSNNAASRAAYQALKNSVAAMREAAQADMSKAENVENLRVKTEQYKETLRTTEQTLRANGDATQSLGDRLGALAGKFGAWLSVTQVIMYAVRAVRQMVSASIELESALAQLQIVTGASEGELRKFKDTAVDLAKDLGQSVTDVMKSIEVFSRLGYSLPDATELTKYSTILANVAAVSTDEATTGLTSIIKGYNLKVEDAQHVADVLVEVGQKYAVSAGEMMEAYERSGAALNATNTSFEKSAGLIAAANAAVQDASAVGTALKTISARIQSSKTDLEELGESTDDLAEGFSKYAAEIQALTGVNIMVEGTTDTFKDLYDIMSEIAGVWDQLTGTQQARVSEILGGTRQRQIISSIIGNWKDAAGAYETAINSAGAATRANDIYMGTAAAHINQLKAAFQELSSNLITSSFVTSIIDIGRHILEIVNAVAKVVDAIGGLKTVLAITASIFAIVNAEAIFKIVAALMDIPAIITKITAGVTGLAASLSAAQIQMMAFIGIAGAIVAVAAIIGQLDMKAHDLGYAKQQTQDAQRELNNYKDQLESVQGKINTLNEAKLNGKITEQQAIELTNLLAQNEALKAQINLYNEKYKSAQDHEHKVAREQAIRLLNPTEDDALYSGTLDTALASYSTTRDLLNSNPSSAGANRAFQWASDEVLRYVDSIKELLDTLDPEEDAELIEQLSGKLQQVNEVLGITGDTAEEVFEKIGESAAEAAEEVGGSVNDLTTLSDELKGVTERLQEYNDALSGEKGDAASQYGSAFKGFLEDWQAGKTGTNRVRAAVELFIPEDVLQSLDYDLQAAGELLSSELYQRIFSDEGDYGANFANYIRETFGNALDGIVEIRENGDSFDFLISSYSDLANALGMDEDLVIALMDALDAYGVQAMISGEDTKKLAEELGLLDSNASNLSKIQSAIDGLANMGKTEIQIRQILNLLASAGYIDLSNVENLGAKINEAVDAAHHADEVKAEPEITVDISGVEQGTARAQQLIDGVHGTSADIVVNHYDNYYSNDYTGGNSGGSGNKSSNKVGGAKASGGTSSGGKTLVNELKPEIISENGEAYIANGGKPAIVDLAPGAIVLDGDTTEDVLKGTKKKSSLIRSAALGLLNGIKKGVHAIVGNTTTTTTTTTTSTTTTSSVPANVPIKSYGAPIPTNKGTVTVKAGTKGGNATYSPGATNVATIPSYSPYYDGGYGSGGGGYGGGYDDYGSGYGSSSSAKQDSWFDHLYEQHNHMLKMDQESQQQYLDWLDGAYKDAFRQGLLELKDFHKYEEEVYKGRQDLFKDHISDIDHAIGLEQNGENRPTVIVNMYQQLLGDIQNQIDNAHRKGLDDNNEYIQYLQNQWNKYYKDLKGMREDASDDAKDQVDDLVQYRIKMLKQYLKNEINSLKERLSYLKDFYGHQKQMLQDVYETENYLDEQSERRKNVSDVENELKALEFDDSAWAQKRKLQLQQELQEAQKDLDDFERQHALSVAEDELDAMYSIQEAAINARMAQLNERLDDPKALYEQALLDVQNNTVALYEEMIAFNNKYGSGIKQDIVDMWENAYISLRKYAELYGTLYNGISLVNATDYEWPSTSTGSGYASGTRNATHGFHRLDEIGAEYVFTSANGNKYRLLNGGDKVLDSKATNFLYNFANTGGKIIPNMIASSVSGVGGFGGKSSVIGDIRLGDIIIQGNADGRTVSEIRRAQRESVDFMLKEFNRLKK